MSGEVEFASEVRVEVGGKTGNRRYQGGLPTSQKGFFPSWIDCETSDATQIGRIIRNHLDVSFHQNFQLKPLIELADSMRRLANLGH